MSEFRPLYITLSRIKNLIRKNAADIITNESRDDIQISNEWSDPCRYLLRCLAYYANKFVDRSISSGDDDRTALFRAVRKTNFVHLLCYSIDFHLNRLKLGSSLHPLDQLDQLLTLGSEQKVVLGLALSYSCDTRLIAGLDQWIRHRLEELTRLYCSSSPSYSHDNETASPKSHNGSSAVDEGRLVDRLGNDLIHFVALLLLRNRERFGLPDQLVDKFVGRLRVEMPPDQVNPPPHITPLLKSDSLGLVRRLGESRTDGPSCFELSTQLITDQLEACDDRVLVDLLHDLGPGCTASDLVMRQALVDFRSKDLTPQSIARAICFMLQTSDWSWPSSTRLDPPSSSSGLLPPRHGDSSSSPTAKSSIMDRRPASLTHPLLSIAEQEAPLASALSEPRLDSVVSGCDTERRAWNINNFLSVVCQINPSISIDQIISYLDCPEFFISNSTGLELLHQLLSYNLEDKQQIEQRQQLAANFLYNTWTVNPRGQLSLLVRCRSKVSRIQLTNLPHDTVDCSSFLLDGSPTAPHQDECEKKAWQNINYVQALLQLAEKGLYNEVEAEFQRAFQSYPDQVIITLLETQPSSTLRSVLLHRFLLHYLSFRSNSLTILNSVWNGLQHRSTSSTGQQQPQSRLGSEQLRHQRYLLLAACVEFINRLYSIQPSQRHQQNGSRPQLLQRLLGLLVKLSSSTQQPSLLAVLLGSGQSPSLCVTSLLLAGGAVASDDGSIYPLPSNLTRFDPRHAGIELTLALMMILQQSSTVSSSSMLSKFLTRWFVEQLGSSDSSDKSEKEAFACALGEYVRSRRFAFDGSLQRTNFAFNDLLDPPAHIFHHLVDSAANAMRFHNQLLSIPIFSDLNELLNSQLLERNSAVFRDTSESFASSTSNQPILAHTDSFPISTAHHHHNRTLNNPVVDSSDYHPRQITLPKPPARPTPLHSTDNSLPLNHVDGHQPLIGSEHNHFHVNNQDLPEEAVSEGRLFLQNLFTSGYPSEAAFKLFCEYVTSNDQLHCRIADAIVSILVDDLIYHVQETNDPSHSILTDFFTNVLAVCHNPPFKRYASPLWTGIYSCVGRLNAEPRTEVVIRVLTNIIRRAKHTLQLVPEVPGYMLSSPFLIAFPPDIQELMSNTASQYGGRNAVVLPPGGGGGRMHRYRNSTSSSSFNLPPLPNPARDPLQPQQAHHQGPQPPPTQPYTRPDTPEEAITDRVFFLFNNVTRLNFREKTGEMCEILSDERLLPWFANYLVEKRVSTESSFLELFAMVLDALVNRMPRLKDYAISELLRNIKLILGNIRRDIDDLNSRTALKNFGTFLGMLTLARNKPVLHLQIDLKDLLYEAYHKGYMAILHVIPFVCRVMRSAMGSMIFAPPNPWTIGILRVLKEYHLIEEIAETIRFEIEVLFATFKISLKEFVPSVFLSDSSYAQHIEFELCFFTDSPNHTVTSSSSSQETVTTSSHLRSNAADASAVTTAAVSTGSNSSRQQRMLSALFSQQQVKSSQPPLTSAPYGGIMPPGGSGYQPNTLTALTNHHHQQSVNDIASSVPRSLPPPPPLTSSLVHPTASYAATSGGNQFHQPPSSSKALLNAAAATNSSLPPLIEPPSYEEVNSNYLRSTLNLFEQLESLVAAEHNQTPELVHALNLLHNMTGFVGQMEATISRVIREMVVPVFDRAVKVAFPTTLTLVRKDFALDPDPKRMISAAGEMIRHFSAALALLTGRDALYMSLMTGLKRDLTDKLSTLSSQDKDALQSLTARISIRLLPNCLNILQKHVAERAVKSIEKRLEQDFNQRSELGPQRFLELASTKLPDSWAKMPEQLRQKLGGPTASEVTVYEEFPRCIPGFRSTHPFLQGDFENQNPRRYHPNQTVAGALRGGVAPSQQQSQPSQHQQQQALLAAQLQKQQLQHQVQAQGHQQSISNVPSSALDKVIVQIDRIITSLSGSLRSVNEPLLRSLQRLFETVQLLKTSRDPNTATLVISHIVHSFLEHYRPSYWRDHHSAPGVELMKRLREVHFLAFRGVFATESMSSNYTWVVNNVTQTWLRIDESSTTSNRPSSKGGNAITSVSSQDARVSKTSSQSDDKMHLDTSDQRVSAIKWNWEAFAELLRLRIVNLPQLDFYLAQEINGGNRRATTFFIDLLDQLVLPLSTRTTLSTAASLAAKFARPSVVPGVPISIVAPSAASSQPRREFTVLNEYDLWSSLDALHQLVQKRRGASIDPLSVRLILADIRARAQLDLGTIEQAPTSISHQLSFGGPNSPLGVLYTGISQGRTFEDPNSLQERINAFIHRWVDMYTNSSSTDCNSDSADQVMSQLASYGALTNLDSLTRFLRLTTLVVIERSVKKMLVVEQLSSTSSVGSSSGVNRTAVYTEIDAFARLLGILVRRSTSSTGGGDQSSSQQQNSFTIQLRILSKILGIIGGALLKDFDCPRDRSHPMPFLRLLVTLHVEICGGTQSSVGDQPSSIDQQQSPSFTLAQLMPLLLGHLLHALRPERAPGFVFCWIELLIHRGFVGQCLSPPNSNTSPELKAAHKAVYAQLLVDLLKYLGFFLQNALLTTSIQLIYRSTVRFFLVLLHNFPEFLSEYYALLCDVVPSNSRQLRNFILSALPQRETPAVDPLQALLVDHLPSLDDPEGYCMEAGSRLPEKMRRELDAYLATRAPVKLLSELVTELRRPDDMPTSSSAAAVFSFHQQGNTLSQVISAFANTFASSKDPSTKQTDDQMRTTESSSDQSTTTTSLDASATMTKKSSVGSDKFLSDFSVDASVLWSVRASQQITAYGVTDGVQYNVELMANLTLYLCITAIRSLREKNMPLNTSTIAHTPQMDLIQSLVLNLDNEGRYLLLNCMANHLRYPNSHTYYFCYTILYLFSEQSKEEVKEQISRVLIERLIMKRPHPWGLLMTSSELLRNPAYRFWDHEFARCCPEIEDIVINVARSCNTNFTLPPPRTIAPPPASTSTSSDSNITSSTTPAPATSAAAVRHQGSPIQGGVV